jgi:hypothetical protein
LTAKKLWAAPETDAKSEAGLELVCVECSGTSEDGAGWKAEVAVDLLADAELDEVAV